MSKWRCLPALILVGACAPVLAQTSELYLGDWEEMNTFVIQDGKVVRSFKRQAMFDGPAAAVSDTIRYVGQVDGAIGHEYDLDGAPLGADYPNDEFQGLKDGATDGKNFNWSIASDDFDEPQFTVVVADRNWGGMKAAFQPTNRSAGITYDAGTGTLWVTNTVGAAHTVQQYTLDGGLVTEWEITPNWITGGHGIAWDPADDTLWMPESFNSSRLFQYSKTGELLQIVDIPELTPYRLFSAEFQILADGDCYPDFDGSGELDLFDFLEFVNQFNAGADAADCDDDGELSFFDFLCFTNEFNEGC
jgi:hypothetical protein